MPKNLNFCYDCFLKKLCQKKSFSDILDRKQSFLDPKIEVFTRARKWTFFKGVSPWILLKKIELFLIGDFHRNHIRKDRVSKLWKEKNDSKRKKLKF